MQHETKTFKYLKCVLYFKSLVLVIVDQNTCPITSEIGSPHKVDKTKEASRELVLSCPVLSRCSPNRRPTCDDRTLWNSNFDSSQGSSLVIL